MERRRVDSARPERARRRHPQGALRRSGVALVVTFLVTVTGFAGAASAAPRAGATSHALSATMKRTATVAPHPRYVTNRARQATASAPGLEEGDAILPPDNPPANIPPSPDFLLNCSGVRYDDSVGCLGAVLAAIDNGRAHEQLPPMTLPSTWDSLSPTEQLYVVTNLERTVRGLPPLSGMATALDESAQAGAQLDADPSPIAGFPWTRWGSNWAGAVGNPLEAVYFWMYDDGPGSSNVDCPPSGGPGCWGHRDNILMSLACRPCLMGTGFAPTAWEGRYPSWAELLVDTSGSPPLDFRWSQVVPFLSGNPPGSGLLDPDLQEFVLDHAGGRTWNAYDETAETHGLGIYGDPSALYDPADGRLHVYVVTGNDHLTEYVNTGPPSAPWRDWDLTSESGSTVPVAASPAAVFDPADGFIHVYVRAADGHLMEYVDSDSGGVTWHAWDLTTAAAGGSTVAGTPGVVYDPIDGHIHVYVEATDGHLVEYVDSDSGGVTWHAWDLSASAAGGSAVYGVPSPLVDGHDELIHVYVQSSGAHLVEYVDSDSGGVAWHAWDLTFAAGALATGGSPSALLDDTDGCLHIYVRAADGDLTEYVDSDAGGRLWHAWDLSAGAIGGQAVAGAASALVDPDDSSLHVYVRGADGHLVEFDRATSGPWHAWDLTEASGGPSPEGDPSALFTNTPQVFVGGR